MFLKVIAKNPKKLSSFFLAVVHTLLSRIHCQSFYGNEEFLSKKIFNALNV